MSSRPVGWFEGQNNSIVVFAPCIIITFIKKIYSSIFSVKVQANVSSSCIVFTRLFQASASPLDPKGRANRIKSPCKKDLF